MIWITVDVKLPDHAKMAALPSDAARWGWLVTLCKAKEQRRPGSFATERHYRHVLGKYGRFVKDYIKAGLIDREGETLNVHDWRRHQWAAAKGNQEETVENSGGNQEDASRAVPVPVSVGTSTEGGAGGNPDQYDNDERRVLIAMARAGAYIRPESGMGQRVVRLVGRRGADAVLSELARLTKAGPLSDRQIVFGLEDALDKIPTAADARSEDAEQERAKRNARLQEQAAARRIEFFALTGKWDPNFGPEPEWKPEWGDRPKVAA